MDSHQHAGQLEHPDTVTSNHLFLRQSFPIYSPSKCPSKQPTDGWMDVSQDILSCPGKVQRTSLEAKSRPLPVALTPL